MDPTSSNDLLSTPSASKNAPAAPSNHTVTPSTSPKKIVPLELHERDRKAIAYELAKLQHGDTVVFVQYPENLEVYDRTGFKRDNEAFRVHSENLLATGSKKFKELLSESYQAKSKRRNFPKGLPKGVTYVLDLTPPSDGDEAAALIAELSCSAGIRYWYTAASRQLCNVPIDICGGMDEFAQVVKPKSPQKKHHDLVEALADMDFEPEIGPRSGAAPYPPHADEAVVPNPATCSPSKISTTVARSTHTIDEYKRAAEIPEYCPIRHRVGIERLLQIIEGKDPNLDSATKIWTLVVLSKYFDCTKLVVDFIVSWVMVEPNCRFIEILPEVTLKMGLLLQTPLLVRPAFAILVSEHALSTVSHEVRNLDTRKTNVFGRVRENIDEDLLQNINAASLSFLARIERSVSELSDPQMGWFLKLSEYRKLTNFSTWAKHNDLEEELSYAVELESDLANYVRGRILWCLHGQVTGSINKEANAHRRAETYLKDYHSNFGQDIYSLMSGKEKMMTVFPWIPLSRLTFGYNHPTNLLFDHRGVDGWDIGHYRSVAENHGVHRVDRRGLTDKMSEVNNKILKAMTEPGSYSGINSEGHVYNGAHSSFLSNMVMKSVPDEEYINEGTPFFSFSRFCDQAQDYVRAQAAGMLQIGGEFDFVVITDTLLCLNEEEWKHLPIWAMESNGPSGPGPSFYTSPRDTKDLNFGGEYVSTSVPADADLTSQFDRRCLISEISDCFNKDKTEVTCQPEEDLKNEMWKGKGKASDHDGGRSEDADHAGTALLQDEDEELDWDDEEEAFDYGGELDKDEEI